jgi:hypothetical protein
MTHTSESIIKTDAVRSAVGADTALLSRPTPLTPEQLARIEVKDKTASDGYRMLSVWVDGKHVISQVNWPDGNMKNEIFYEVDEEELTAFFGE